MKLLLIILAIALASFSVGFRVGVTHAQADQLDPNDCSRGIDESNQEACDS